MMKKGDQRQEDEGQGTQAIAAALRTAQRVVVLTGAGVSAESGIPTFRDADGLWAGMDPEEVATPEAFARDPALVWGWYAMRRAAMAGAEPNAAHRALAELEARAPAFTLITQNVDGLHHRAGSENVLELHGQLHRARCSGCGLRRTLDPPADLPDRGRRSPEDGTKEGVADGVWEGTAGQPLEEVRRQAPPRCTGCGASLRPDVVWFGETLDGALLERAFDAARRAEIMLSIGTSGIVEPAASLPFAALEASAVVVEVNPAPTPLSSWAHVVLRGAAGRTLPTLIEQAWPSHGDPPAEAAT